jgi:uncharacterized membrane protein
MVLKALSIWLLVASGVQLGTLWIMKTSILPLLAALPYDRYVNTCQLIDMHVFHPIALWNGMTGAGLGVAMSVLAPDNASRALFALGAVAMLAVGITSEGVNRPIWRQIEMWSPRRIVSQWAQRRRIWHLAHEIRTVGALVAVVSFGASAVFVATS